MIDLSNVSPHKKINANGLSCDITLLKTVQTMENMRMGEILEIYGIDPLSMNDIPDWCTRSGNLFLGGKEDCELMRFYIQKS